MLLYHNYVLHQIKPSQNIQQQCNCFLTRNIFIACNQLRYKVQDLYFTHLHCVVECAPVSLESRRNAQLLINGNICCIIFMYLPWHCYRHKYIIFNWQSVLASHFVKYEIWRNSYTRVNSGLWCCAASCDVVDHMGAARNA